MKRFFGSITSSSKKDDDSSNETTPLVMIPQQPQTQQYYTTIKGSDDETVVAVPTKDKQRQQQLKQQQILLKAKRRNSDGSLDFERIVNFYSIQAKKDRLHEERKSSFSKETIRWVLTICCALISGCTTVIIVWATQTLVEWRRVFLANSLTENRNNEYQYWIVFGWYLLISMVLADTASVLCIYWPGIPEAVGSGIPEVKAYLNGIRVKKFNNPTLLWVKMVGSILSVGSSMAVGMEGPLVMIGAYAGATLAHIGTSLSSFTLKIIRLKHNLQTKESTSIFGRCVQRVFFFFFGGGFGSQQPNDDNDKAAITDTIKNLDREATMSPLLYRIWMFCTSDLSYFANDAERRKLITIGAACGFAASFGAPIGGMLFILDDISTFFSKDMFLRILVANAVGTFCLAYYKGDLSYYGAINFGDYKGRNNETVGTEFHAIPFYVLLGMLLGTLGGVFCKGFRSVKLWSGKKFNTPRLRLLRITWISVVNSIIMFALPSISWFCHDVPSSTKDDVTEIQAERQFFCDVGQTNQMASVFFGSRGKAIVRILSEPEQFYVSTLAIVGFVFFTLMLFTNTTSIPSGLFTPIVISGASLGASYGLFLERYVDERFSPSSFALLGVGAMMAGIQRSTVSTCVILVEGTGQMKVLLPVMIVVVVANYFAYLIHKDGIYEVLIDLKGYPYLEHSKDDRYDVFTVSEVMSSPAVTVREHEHAKSLVKTLKSNTHCGFPVVDNLGRFKGLVRRKQIVALMECGIFRKKTDPHHGRSSSSFSLLSSGSNNQQQSDGTVVSSNTTASNSKREGSVTFGGLQGLMHFAYHIKDNRYNAVPKLNNNEEGHESDDSSSDDEEDPKNKNIPEKTADDDDAARDIASSLIASSTTAETSSSGETKSSSDRSCKSLWDKLKTKTQEASERRRKKIDDKGLLGGDITMPTVSYDHVYSSDDFFKNLAEDDDRGINGNLEDIVDDDDEVEDVARASYLKSNGKEDDDDDHDDTGTITTSTGTVLRSGSGTGDGGSGGGATDDITTSKRYAHVGWDSKKNVVIVKWLNPEYKDDIIDLEAVMNRGAYTVPEDFPLSKAYNLFTLLGLRWIVVVNRMEGGVVVGMLTRESFLYSHLKEKTGIDVKALL